MPNPNPVLAIIDAPYGLGASRSGCQMGPEAMRIVGLADGLRGLGQEVRDLGALAPEIPAPGGEPQPIVAARETAAWIGAAARAVAASLGRRERPILIGGDHSLGAGGALGAAAHWAEEGRPLYTLWIDAHGDFNTPATSPSGKPHGMALAAACGEPGLEPMLADAPAARLDPGRIMMLGLRSIDPGERSLLRERGVRLVDMRRIDEFGVIAPLRSFLEEIERASGALHVSFDLDALDPGIAPGVGTPAPGGLTYREAHLVMEMLHDSGLVRSVDLMELNPFLDDRGKSAELMADLAASLFGRRIIDPDSR